MCSFVCILRSTSPPIQKLLTAFVLLFSLVLICSLSTNWNPKYRITNSKASHDNFLDFVVQC